jgi:hypothetical protein
MQKKIMKTLNAFGFAVGNFLGSTISGVDRKMNDRILSFKIAEDYSTTISIYPEWGQHPTF